VVDGALGHVRGAGDVDGRHSQVRVEAGVGEGASGGDADVHHGAVDRSAKAFDEAPEPFDAVVGRRVAWWLQTWPPSPRGALRAGVDTFA
jgi:hypothetical protein